MTYEAQVAMDAIENNVAIASSFLTATDSGISDPYPPTANGGAWSYRGESTSSRSLILRSFSTTTHPQQRGASSRLPVFIGSPSGSECQTQNLNYNDAEEYNTVIFLKNSTLYRRVLVRTANQYCNPGQYQKLSCPSQVDLTAAGQGTRNASCQADDEVLATNVTNFSVQYFDNVSDSTATNAYAGGASAVTVTDATALEISLTVSGRNAGSGLTQTSVQRLSRLNGEGAS